MRLECNQQVERLDLIVALLTIQKTRVLYINEQAALDKNLKELETFLVNHGDVDNQ